MVLVYNQILCDSRMWAVETMTAGVVRDVFSSEDRKVDHPQARWNDYLRRVASSSWMRVAEDRVR